MDVHPASVQDRDGAESLLRETRKRFPFIERIIGDGGYQGPKMAALVKKTGAWTLQIVKRSDLAGFVVLPKRWIVERTLAWISRNRRLCRDYERHARKADAFVRLAMIRIMLRRLGATPQLRFKLPGWALSYVLVASAIDADYNGSQNSSASIIVGFYCDYAIASNSYLVD